MVERGDWMCKSQRKLSDTERIKHKPSLSPVFPSSADMTTIHTNPEVKILRVTLHSSFFLFPTSISNTNTMQISYKFDEVSPTVPPLSWFELSWCLSQTTGIVFYLHSLLSVSIPSRYQCGWGWQNHNLPKSPHSNPWNLWIYYFI